MNTLFIIVNTTLYAYHKELLTLLESKVFLDFANTYTIDIDKQQTRSTVSQQLLSTNPDLIITLDLAGFEFRTLTGECLLNMLPCKVCNILWGNKSEYCKYLTGKLSLSMLFYDATGTDNQLPSKYPNMRYYYPTSRAIPTTTLNDTESEIIETLQNIWNHFIAEVLL